MKAWTILFTVLLTCTSFAKSLETGLSSPISLQDRIRIIEVEKQRLNNLIQVYGLKEESRSSRLFDGKGCGDTTIVIGDDDDDDHGIVSPKCEWRSSNGTCLTYGEDIPGKKCVPFCTWRSSNGTCLTYGEDVCN